RRAPVARQQLALPFPLVSVRRQAPRSRHVDAHGSSPQHQPPRLAAVAIAAPARRALGALRSQRILPFLLQNLRDEFAHPLPQPLLQTLPPGIPLLLVWARCRATVRHGVSSCGRDLQRRDPGFVFNDFSGAYAFHFSTGIGTEPGPLDGLVLEVRWWPTISRPTDIDNADIGAMGALRVIVPLLHRHGKVNGPSKTVILIRGLHSHDAHVPVHPHDSSPVVSHRTDNAGHMGTMSVGDS